MPLEFIAVKLFETSVIVFALFDNFVLSPEYAALAVDPTDETSEVTDTEAEVLALLIILLTLIDLNVTVYVAISAVIFLVPDAVNDANSIAGSLPFAT